MNSLSHLIWKKKLSYDQAFATLNSTNAGQALAIEKGFERSAVENLTNDQAMVVGYLYRRDITPDDVRDCAWLNTRDHQLAFIHLFTNHYSLKSTKDILSQLNEHQANAIWRGLAVVDAAQLTDEYRLEALVILKHHGLDATHLKSEDWFNSKTHVQALCLLMEKNGKKFLGAEAALTYLRNRSLDDIHKMIAQRVNETLEKRMQHQQIAKEFDWTPSLRPY